tara:strand:+ start:154 stop:540 length:387 start_codon:yes stop_codon:yes gene_type:complete
MSSELIVDELTGRASAGSIAVTAEGGTVTTNLQQGLAKAWVFSAADAALTNSLNLASGTDNGTGTYTYAYTSNLANGDCAAGASATDNADLNVTVYSTSATVFSAEVFNQAGNEHDSRSRTIICGDLA